MPPSSGDVAGGGQIGHSGAIRRRVAIDGSHHAGVSMVLDSRRGRAGAERGRPNRFGRVAPGLHPGVSRERPIMCCVAAAARRSAGESPPMSHGKGRRSSVCGAAAFGSGLDCQTA